MTLNDGGQFPCHAMPRDRCISDGAQALLRHIINDDKNPVATAIGKLIVDEVE